MCPSGHIANSWQNIENPLALSVQSLPYMKYTLALILLFATNAFADPLCNSVDLHKQSEGFQCQTSKGALFTRVARDGFGDAWRDPDGLIWSNRVGTGNHEQAEKICAKLGATIPTRADFERDEALGLREVLYKMADTWYWSATGYPTDTADSLNAYAYFGTNGMIGTDQRTAKYVTIRCVSR